MTYREALTWLDQHGGRWAVHATSAACVVVVVSLGSVQVRAPAKGLSSECVDAALLDAIHEIRRNLDSEARDSSRRWRMPPRSHVG